MNNTGHGHVFPRADGVKARCGGPAICKQCAGDLARSLGKGTQSELAKALDTIMAPGFGKPSLSPQQLSEDLDATIDALEKAMRDGMKQFITAISVIQQRVTTSSMDPTVAEPILREKLKRLDAVAKVFEDYDT